MESAATASLFKGLGHPVRLGMYKQLLIAGNTGLTVGELHKGFSVSNSTFSQHISKMVAAGLVKQERHGKTLRCFALLESFNSAAIDLLALPKNCDEEHLL